MTLREFLAKVLETGDLDKPVKVRIVRRSKEPGSVVAERILDTVRFGRMAGGRVIYDQANYIVIEAEDLDNAKEMPT